MPVRIYALAKELKMDSKELVDACTRAGVTGKGSALASLTDDEAKKVREHLSGKSSKPAAAPSPVASTAPTKKNLATAGRAITRDDYVAPGGVAGRSKPKSLDAKPAADKDKTAEKPKPTQKQEPVVKLAAIPQAPEPTVPTSSPNDPPAQKPIMTLPKDAIRGAKEGSSAPLKQFTRQQESPRRGTGAGAAAPAAKVGGGMMPPADPAEQKGRGKRAEARSIRRQIRKKKVRVREAWPAWPALASRDKQTVAVAGCKAAMAFVVGRAA